MVVIVILMALLALFTIAMVLVAGFLFMYWLIAYNYYRFFANHTQIKRAYYNNITNQVQKTNDYKQFENELNNLINR